jgi:hypothetical protein
MLISQGDKESQQPLLQRASSIQLLQGPNPASKPSLDANVAEVAPITLTRDLAAKSPERADMFNTRKFAGNICPSSRSGRRSDERDARQKRAKTRHF